MANSLSKDQILEALAPICAGVAKEAGGGGGTPKVSVCEGLVAVTVACAPDSQRRATLRAGIEAALRQRAAEAGTTLDGITVQFVDASPAPAPAKGSKTMKDSGAVGVSQPPGIRHVVAVGAGKGGVGKSTVAVNLAVGLARQGHAVGLLDADIYGPSIPTLMGLDTLEPQMFQGMLQPFLTHGVKAMTIGKLVDPEKPLIWRGPMAHGAFKQLVEQTAWGDLDYLILDLPPGTGDVSLTMAQLLTVTGAVIVCTPQKVAQDDAVRAVRMFQTLHIEPLGVVENMSYFLGDDGKEYDLFGRGGAERMARRLGLPFLGAIPIRMALRMNSDAGDPSANFDRDGGAGEPGSLRHALEHFTRRVEDEIAQATLRGAGSGASLTVS